MDVSEITVVVKRLVMMQQIWKSAQAASKSFSSGVSRQHRAVLSLDITKFFSKASRMLKTFHLSYVASHCLSHKAARNHLLCKGHKVTHSFVYAVLAGLTFTMQFLWY